MREYSKVSPLFWIGETGKELRKLGMEAQIVGMYLMTGPHANMLGLYYLPMPALMHETGLTFEGASKGLRSCIEAYFASYDPHTEMVWVREMAAWQIGKQLKASDLRCKGIQSDYDALPENPFLSEFYDRYSGPFHLENRREKAPKKDKGPERGFEGPSKPGAGAGAGTRAGTGTGAGAEEARTVEFENSASSPSSSNEDVRPFAVPNLISDESPGNARQTATEVPDARMPARQAARGGPVAGQAAFALATPDGQPLPPQPDRLADIVMRVFEHWRVNHQPRAKYNDKRGKLIRAALKDYGEADLCQAITGYLHSPFHQGENDRQTKYTGLELMLRDAKHIDDGLGFYERRDQRRLSVETQSMINRTAGWVPPELRNQGNGTV